MNTICVETICSRNVCECNVNVLHTVCIIKNIHVRRFVSEGGELAVP